MLSNWIYLDLKRPGMGVGGVLTVSPFGEDWQVYLGEQYVNSSTLSDVTFLVEGWRSTHAYIHVVFSCFSSHSLVFVNHS
jgi:hypothetical protein